MPKVSPIQQNFNAGELSPLLFGRTEFDAYKGGLDLMLNHIPYVQGGITRRPGFHFAAEVKDSTKKTRVVAFKFSDVQAYIIEFGDLYIRFFRNNGPVTEDPDLVITGISQANPGVVSYTGADPTNGQHIYLNGIVGMVELNNKRVVVANVDGGADTFEMAGVDTTLFTAYSSGGTAAVAYEIVSTILEAELFQLKFVQSADILYIFHSNFLTKKLSRTAHTNWTLTDIIPLDGPYLLTNNTATTMQPSVTSGTINITASSIVGVNGGVGFKANDVGRIIRIKHSATWGYAEITVITSTTVVVAVVKSNFGANTASAFWRFGLWGEDEGFASTGTFFEDRLWLGGNITFAQRLDSSRTGDYENFAPTDTDGVVAADHALSITLSSDDVQIVRWLKSEERGLIVGTLGGEWIIRPSSQGESLTPTNINAKQSTFHGSLDHQAITAGKAILFIQKAGRKVRELAYVFEIDGFKSPDLTVLSEHITRSGIRQLAFQEEPQSIVWGYRNDGKLVGLTYERDQKVIGWHGHSLGGFSDAAKLLPPLVESIAVIPAADETRDELWCVVNRHVNGGTKRYIEFLTKMWEQEDDQEEAFFVDSGLTYDGVPTTQLTGLHHLVGETVKILVDGFTHPDRVVSATGQITLNVLGSKVAVGYGYKSDGKMLRIDAGAADGTAQGKIQRIHKISFRLLDTLGFKSGRDFNNLTEYVFRISSDPTNTKVPLFTGDILIDWDGGNSNTTHVHWRFDSPLPGTILAVMPRMHTQDA